MLECKLIIHKTMHFNTLYVNPVLELIKELTVALIEIYVLYCMVLVWYSWNPVCEEKQHDRLNYSGEWYADTSIYR